MVVEVFEQLAVLDEPFSQPGAIVCVQFLERLLRRGSFHLAHPSNCTDPHPSRQQQPQRNSNPCRHLERQIATVCQPWSTTVPSMQSIGSGRSSRGLLTTC